MPTSTGYDILQVLSHVDPRLLNYQEWLQVGMALKTEGYAVHDWESWSIKDYGRYHTGECQSKWDGFVGTGITGGTIVQYAKDQGWEPEHKNYGNEIDWNGVIGGREDLKILDTAWLEDREIQTVGDDWHPAKELIRYLETLFEAGDNVGYVTESWYNEDAGKFLPTKGHSDRTAGQLIEELSKCNDDIGKVLGDYKEEAGAWIRFNPLDGNGVKNENVTDFRYALVESDSMPIEQQNAIIHELQLPVAVLVHSGGKSLHAIVRIEANNYAEYRSRVEYLYNVCKQNGLEIDSQNRNPSRLSRMPGVVRNGQKQYIIATNTGLASYTEWKEFIESANDNLPDVECLADVWENLPPLAPPLIEGVLRQGHKMLLAGPSKAGKSFALIELCIALAEGREWMGFKCAQGRVFYVNLELDPASCKHRFKDVYNALGWASDNISNIDTWDLRGKAVPMDQFAPKLIRRCLKRDYIAIIIDPIYKVLTGDENAADQMAKFCNQFDLIAAELGCSVIYCHHHSKGAQGDKKSMDRASGSGVFARDPDALLDMIELAVPDNVFDTVENNEGCRMLVEYLNKCAPNWHRGVSSTAYGSMPQMVEIARRNGISDAMIQVMLGAAHEAQEKALKRTAWRIEGTLREFERFAPVNLWFDYPIHKVDANRVLENAEFEGSKGATWINNFRKEDPEKAKEDRKAGFDMAYDACAIGGKVTIQSLAEYLGCTVKTVRNRAKEHGGFWIDDSEIGRKSMT